VTLSFCNTHSLIKQTLVLTLHWNLLKKRRLFLHFLWTNISCEDLVYVVVIKMNWLEQLTLDIFSSGFRKHESSDWEKYECVSCEGWTEVNRHYSWQVSEMSWNWRIILSLRKEQLETWDNYYLQCHSFIHSQWIQLVCEASLAVDSIYKIYNSELTSESPVYSLDSAENHTDPSLLDPAGPGCSSGSVFSDGRVWTSELSPEKNSWSLTTCSSPIWIKNQKCEFRRQTSCLKPQRVKQTK